MAVCCSRPSASRFKASARRCSRSRPRASSRFCDLRETAGLAFAGFGPRPMNVSLRPSMLWPGIG